jgi:hypothetical protein
MKRLVSICLFLHLVVILYGQQTDYRFTGSFVREPVEDFIEAMEQSLGVTFFFRAEWVTGIRISAQGTDLSLSRVLASHLQPFGIDFYMDDGANIFIVPGDLVVLGDELKSGREYQQTQALEPTSQESLVERYFGGGATQGIIESVVIGTESEATRGSTVRLYGKVRDRQSGESMIGATIYVNDTRSGTATDYDGEYQMVLSPGDHQLIVNSMGMKERKYNLSIHSDGRLDIDLEKEIIALNEVVITAEKNQNVSGIQMGYANIDIKTIKEIPLVMGEKDVLKVAQMLPGVQTVGEGASGFNVRGSSADQNLFYINNIPVYNTSHLFGFFSSFSPDIVKDFNLYKSNIPVEYGGRIASVFNVSTREGNKNHVTARGGISPITGHVAVEGPLKKEKHSFVLSARSTYSDWILRFLEDPDLRESRASFYDLSAGITLEPDDRNLVRVFGYYSSDQFKYSDLLEYDYQNLGASISWKRRISPALNLDLSTVYSQYAFGTINKEYLSSAYEHDYQIGHWETRAGFNWTPGSKHLVTFGGNMIYYDLKRGTVNPFGPESNRIPLPLGTDHGLESSVFIGDKYTVLPWLTIYGGIRFAHFAYLGPSEVYTYVPGAQKLPENVTDTLRYNTGEPVKTYSGPDFRLAFNVRTGATSSIKLSYNRIRQHLFLMTNTVAIAPTDQWKLSDYHIGPPYGDQISAGFYKDFRNTGIRTSAEVYLKRVHDVVEYRSGADFIGSARIEEDILQGKQDAYGVEMILEKERGRLNGWISYAYSRSLITVDGAEPWERINGGISYPANYDKPHAINLILNYRLNRRLSLSGNMVYQTGRPVTYPVSSYYLNGQQVINYSERNAYRLPDYFRIDLSVNLEGNLRSRKKIHSYWMINIYNLTGRRNAYSVYYRSEEGQINSYRISIFGTTIVSLSWNFKFGNYASD